MNSLGLGEVIRESGLERLYRFYSVYTGIVISRDDPKRRNRLLVSIPEIDSSYHVWAQPLSQPGGLGQGAKYQTPRVADKVWIFFEKGDPLYPVWTYRGWFDKEVPSDLNVDSIGMITYAGNKIIFQDDQGRLLIQILSSDGSSNATVLEINRGGINISCNNANINTEGSVNINTGDEINLNGNNQGIPLTDQVVSKLNQLENRINQLSQAFITAGSVAVPMDGGKAAFASLSTWNNPTITLTTQSDIENPKVKEQ